MALLLALVLAGVLLAGLFRDHVLRQFGDALTAQLDQVTARLEFDAAGQPQLDAQTLSDPRWSRPYSGLYWQVDERGAGRSGRGVLRSRSLWDATLERPGDALADGAVHRHEVAGPGGARLLLVERTVTRDDAATRHAGACWSPPTCARPRPRLALQRRPAGFAGWCCWACCAPPRWRRWPSDWHRCAPCSALARCTRAARSGWRGVSRTRCSR